MSYEYKKHIMGILEEDKKGTEELQARSMTKKFPQITYPKSSETPSKINTKKWGGKILQIGISFSEHRRSKVKEKSRKKPEWGEVLYLFRSKDKNYN